MTNQNEPADRTFTISRLFDAPRDLVFKAWTDPKHMMRWWGPKEFTTPTCQMDVKPGGRYRIVMRGPDGTDYPMKGVFLEVTEPERIVMSMDCSEHPAEWHNLVAGGRSEAGNKFVGEIHTTATFEAVDGKTKLTVRQRFDSPGIYQAMQKIGMSEGWSQSLDRLAALVKKA